MVELLAFVIIAGLCVYRLCRLAIIDKIFDTPRSRVNMWLITRRGRGAKFFSWLHDMINCGWCLSIWISGALVLWQVLAHGLPMPFIVWMATAATATWAWNAAEPAE